MYKKNKLIFLQFLFVISLYAQKKQVILPATSFSSDLIYSGYFSFKGIQISNYFELEKEICLNINDDEKADYLLLLVPKSIIPPLSDDFDFDNNKFYRRMLFEILSCEDGYIIDKTHNQDERGEFYNLRYDCIQEPPHEVIIKISNNDFYEPYQLFYTLPSEISFSKAETYHDFEERKSKDYWESRRNKTLVDGDFKISYVNDYNPATYNCDSQDFEIEIAKNGIPIQKLYYRIPDYAFYNFSKRVIFEDYNFDGKKDIVIPLDYSGARNETYQCFFWDEIKNQFYPSDIFKSLPNPELDYERKCIYTSSSLNYSHRIYETYVFSGTDFIIKSRLHEIYTLTDLYAFSKDYGLPPNTDMVDYFKLPNPNDEGAFKAPVFIKEKWEDKIRNLDLPSRETEDSAFLFAQ